MIMTNNKDKKVLNVPNLRFPEFTDKWEAGKLEEYILLVSGQDLSSEQYTDKEDVYPYITGASSLNSEGIILNRWTHTPTQIVKRGDILLVCKGSGVGQLTVLSNVDKAHIARQIMGIRAKNTESQLFIYHYLSRLMTELKKRSTGIIPGIDRKSILSLHISIPSLQEQQKVAELLSLIEQRIITQNKIIEDLKKLKSAICEKLFSSPKDKQPQIRLYGFFGDWHFVRLSDICHRICRKNTGEQCKQVLTIAAQYGLVSQEEFFNKNVASENLSGYYLLQKGDFAYNKSYSGDYVWGTVKRLDNYEQGVLSPLYICFRPDPARVDSDFLIYYFESKKWHKTVANIAGEGARNHGLLNISVVDYFNTIHCIPSMDEQKQIAQIIGTLLSKIAREQRMLNCYAAQRQYLLRQMFI